MPKLPIAIDHVTACVIESGRARCRLDGAGDYEFPFDGVLALAASTGIVCAIHGDLVDCHLSRAGGEADLRFDAPGAAEIDIDWGLICVKTEARELQCHHIDTEKRKLSPMVDTRVANGVVDFELDHSSLVYIDAEGTTWLAPLRISEESEGRKVEIVDELDLPFPKAKRVSGNGRTVAVVALDGTVWVWKAPKRGVDPVKPAREVAGVEGVFDVVAYNGAICATTPKGVWCAGDNVDGQLGPTAQYHDVPMTKMPVPGQPVAIEVSWGKFCAGDAQSPPYCWGSSSWPFMRGLYQHPTPVIERGSVAIDVDFGRVCSTDGRVHRTCYGRSNDIMQHPFAMDRGWQPDFGEAVRRSGSCALSEDGTLRCFARKAPDGRVVETKVSRFSTYADRVCYVRHDNTLGCASNEGKNFDIEGVSNAVDVALWPDGACVLTTRGTASCFDIPENPKLRSANDDVVERSVFKPRLRKVRGAQRLSELEASDSYLCGLDGSENTVHCWRHGKEGKKPQRVDVAARTLRLTSFFGCGLTVDAKPYCMRAKDDIAMMNLQAPFDRSVEEFEFVANRFAVGPLCTRDAKGRVDCQDLYRHMPILWPPTKLMWPFD